MVNTWQSVTATIDAYQMSNQDFIVSPCMAWTVSDELLGQSAEAVLARENNEV